MKTEEDEAFEDIERRQGGFPAKRAMAADKLQEPAQRPVAFITNGGKGELWWARSVDEDGIPNSKDIPLYTAPPQREWVGLTDEDIYAVLGKLQDMYNRPPTEDSRIVFAQAIGAKLKEKNNGT